MNYALQAACLAAVGIGLSGCSHSLPLTPGQAATISPAAAAFLQKSTYTTVPSFVPIRASQVIAGRATFDESEAPAEEELMRKYSLQTRRTTIAGVPVLIITPGNPVPGLKDAVAINLHGGGFVLGSPRDRSALLIAGTLGITVYSIDYSMAPETKFPVAVDQSLEVYRALQSQFRPERMIGVSSSAGGQIMLAMLLKAHRQGLPMMRAQVLFTPAADISGDGDSATGNDGRDVVSLAMTLRSVQEFYLGGADPHDPAVSPLYDTFPSSFPQSVIVSGTRDLLLSNAVRLFWKLKSVDVDAELLVTEGGWHGFHWEYDTPESAMTMAAVRDFLAARLLR